MKNFAFPLQIHGIEQQLAHVAQKLINLGYAWTTRYEATRYDYRRNLVTNFTGANGRIGYTENRNDFNRIVVNASDMELLLALAAACTNDTFQKDEPIVFKNNDTWNTAQGLTNSPTKGNIYRRPTKEEIISHFADNRNKKFEGEPFILPAKWAIKRTIENFAIVNEYFNKVDSLVLPHSYLGSNSFIHSNKLDYNSRVSDYLQRDYTEITFDQFKKYVLKESERKIIGYKAPMDLFNKSVKKDTIFVYRTDFEAGQYKPKPPNGSIVYTMPKEIVETWEPVYEIIEVPEEKLVLGSSKIEITIKQGTIYADGKPWNINILKHLIECMSEDNIQGIYNYKVSYPSIKIGCSIFTREELQQIINTANRQSKGS